MLMFKALRRYAFCGLQKTKEICRQKSKHNLHQWTKANITLKKVLSEML